MCSHHQLRNGTVLKCKRDDVTVTLVVLPLKHKCCRKRVLKFIITTSKGPPRVIHQILMQAGDIESNPGPPGMYVCIQCLLKWSTKQYFSAVLFNGTWLAINKKPLIT